jgi:hypothetical protein
MTAVEFLLKQIFSEDDKSFLEFYNGEIKRALELEKHQIIDAYVDGFKECEKIHEEAFFIQDLSEQYYNETFKKD